MVSVVPVCRTEPGEMGAGTGSWIPAITRVHGLIADHLHRTLVVAQGIQRRFAITVPILTCRYGISRYHHALLGQGATTQKRESKSQQNTPADWETTVGHNLVFYIAVLIHADRSLLRCTADSGSRCPVPAQSAKKRDVRSLFWRQVVDCTERASVSGRCQGRHCSRSPGQGKVQAMRQLPGLVWCGGEISPAEQQIIEVHR